MQQMLLPLALFIVICWPTSTTVLQENGSTTEKSTKKEGRALNKTKKNLFVTKPTQEDDRILNESIAQYGPAQDYKKLDLPGPQLTTNVKNESKQAANFTTADSGNYVFRYRVVTASFAYNARYEKGELKKNDKGDEVLQVKGQFGEKFERKSGGHYVRTVGYIVDDNGYRSFLLDLSAVVKMPKGTDERPVLVAFLGEENGDDLKSISSTVIITLNG